MGQLRSMPVVCPSCNKKLRVQAFTCPCCSTRIEGNYVLPNFVMFPNEDQEFMVSFIKCSGSLKQMAAQLGLSYPTVRSRLDDIIKRFKTFERFLNP